MLTTKKYSQLIYLDRDYISARYEILTEISANTQITRTEGIQAGVKIPMFNAGASSVETKSFAISTLEMLAEVMPSLGPEPDLDPGKFRPNMPSITGWVSGNLSTIRVTPTDSNAESTAEPQSCFVLREAPSMGLALITTPQYFVSGLDAFTKMHGVLVRDLSIPVRALVRVVAAQNHIDQWIAIPYVISERDT